MAGFRRFDMAARPGPVLLFFAVFFWFLNFFLPNFKKKIFFLSWRFFLPAFFGDFFFTLNSIRGFPIRLRQEIADERSPLPVLRPEIHACSLQPSSVLQPGRGMPTGQETGQPGRLLPSPPV